MIAFAYKSVTRIFLDGFLIWNLKCCNRSVLEPCGVNLTTKSTKVAKNE